MAEELKQMNSQEETFSAKKERLFLMNDYAGRATSVPESQVEGWSKLQDELEAKLKRGEIPDPNILTAEDKELIESIFGPGSAE